MVTVEDCILGNSALHDRFFATTEILARLVSSAPRAVGMAQLEEATGRSEKELLKLCTALSRAGLLREDAPGKWALTCDASLVTLEDVYRCAMSEQQTRSRKPAADRAPNDVDLLVMQAMIAINQSVFKHLRQFSLDRLKVSAAGMFPSTRRALRDPGMEDSFDFTVSGREASYSPEQVAA
ncbi:Rrf2 family transcriptional regulator [Noviherbaspirillum denitrificans]|uniref:Uncharacterized protein n=1 Tax=Noviherbaspirillum denitrificans TaxID=1968433 RepID=A0A254TBX9_9BURK|nr:Rrf2 family transcriptional regulator [Noviherbaspirillum denitrificans]OWW20055.1 hypothetical protein AYR66_11685 [Noviherbaspirillum denitrificans]